MTNCVPVCTKEMEQIYYILSEVSVKKKRFDFVRALHMQIKCKKHVKNDFAMRCTPVYDSERAPKHL